MKILRPLILFLTGFCTYITIEVCFRGYSYPLMGLVAGLVFLFLDCINDTLLTWDMDILIQGCFGSIIITFCELIIGTIQHKYGLIPMWDYSNMALNYHGIICLPFSLIWMGLSILGIILADSINYYVFKIEPKPYYCLFGKVIIQFK